MTGLVLASGSKARKALLAGTGLAFRQVSPDLDEMAASEPLLRAGAGAGDIASTLALAKATLASEAEPQALVIAADQTLELDGRLFRKAEDMDAARQQLLELSGKTHYLHSAVACMRAGKTLFEARDSAAITLRAIRADEVGRYLAAAGPQILSSVGLYQLEGPGIRLIESVEGDYFTVLGLPLLPLLGFLRENGLGTF
ncbi:Maf family protein [Afifella aestuarii]|uniref:Maf family protein n=1 Tax=Afifella aestuarii TaxID=1909496 RepID=UPI000FE2B67E|nr:Maf family protein [Afifella aestuarii]